MFKKNNFSLFLFELLIIIFEFVNIKPYITLSLDTINPENIKSPYTKNSIHDLMFSEYVSPLFTEMEIGSPTQKIPLLIEPKTNDFVITSIYPKEDSNSSFYLNKTLFDFSEILKGRNFFNEKKSNTFNSEMCKNREIYYEFSKYNEYDTAVSEETCPAHDTLYLYQDINMKNKIKLSNSRFDLVRNIVENVTGILGLHLLADRRTEVCFLNFLKKNNLTDNYNFFFDFDSNKNKKGKLIIGSFPDEIYEKKYKREDLSYSTSNRGYAFYNIFFDKIYIKDGNTSIYNLERKDAEICFDHDLIMAEDDYKKILENSLKDLIEEKKCFSSDFIGIPFFYESNKRTQRNISFFYCMNTVNIINELKKRILPIKFFTHEYNNYTFEITSEDIIMQKGDYILIKIVFPDFTYTWTLGKPFSLKYNFLFNPDIKKLGFYVKSDSNNSGENNTWKYAVYIILIIVLIAIFVILGIFLGKKIYGLKRKIRANEMDDDYEYFEGKIKKDLDNGDVQNTIN